MGLEAFPEFLGVCPPTPPAVFPQSLDHEVAIVPGFDTGIWVPEPKAMPVACYQSASQLKSLRRSVSGSAFGLWV